MTLPDGEIAAETVLWAAGVTGIRYSWEPVTNGVIQDLVINNSGVVGSAAGDATPIDNFLTIVRYASIVGVVSVGQSGAPGGSGSPTGALRR